MHSALNLLCSRKPSAARTWTALQSHPHPRCLVNWIPASAQGCPGIDKPPEVNASKPISNNNPNQLELRYA